MYRQHCWRSTPVFAAVCVIVVSACSEGPTAVDVVDDPMQAVVSAAQLVSWTGDGAPGGVCPTVASGTTRTWTFMMTTPDAATSILNATFHEGEVSVPATLTAFVDNNIVLTANAAGPSGDLISVEILDPGSPHAPLSLSWSGTQLTVTLATDDAGRIVTTASHLLAAVNAHPSSMVTGTLAAGSDGTGRVQPLAETSLAGGGAAAATLTVTFHDDVRFTAATAGPAGNAVSVAINDAGVPFAPLTIMVNGDQLVVTLATDGNGKSSTTVLQMVAAISANPASPVTASVLPDNNGTGLASVLAQTNLAGGSVDQVINQYQVAGVKQGGGRSPFRYEVPTIADALLLSASATGGRGSSKLSVVSCD